MCCPGVLNVTTCTHDMFPSFSHIIPRSTYKLRTYISTTIHSPQNYTSSHLAALNAHIENGGSFPVPPIQSCHSAVYLVISHALSRPKETRGAGNMDIRWRRCFRVWCFGIGQEDCLVIRNEFVCEELPMLQLSDLSDFYFYSLSLEAV